MRIFITGGAGFIGSAAARSFARAGHDVLVADALTYAGDRRRLSGAMVRFEHTDIRDRVQMRALLDDFRPRAILHCAAESHVDRSIDGPAAFVDTNVTGTFVLLEGALALARSGTEVRFVHVSTDEVFGSLGATGAFDETSPYAPNSPYAASKAASDHLVRAWHATYGLDACVTHCTNNYGPFQHAEKFIPTVIRNALTGREIPVYGNGAQVRDWLHVDDHVAALALVIGRGKPGRSYTIGARNECANLTVARRICALLDRERPSPGGPYEARIAHVEDRPGHDLRYAIDPKRIEAELGWRPELAPQAGLAATVQWYLDHEDWWRPGASTHGRLGLGKA